MPTAPANSPNASSAGLFEPRRRSRPARCAKPIIRCALRPPIHPANAMSCLEDKPHKWDRPGKYKCTKCDATADKKAKLCKAKKIKGKSKEA